MGTTVSQTPIHSFLNASTFPYSSLINADIYILLQHPSMKLSFTFSSPKNMLLTSYSCMAQTDKGTAILYKRPY